MILEKELYFDRDGLKIWGKLFLPEGDGPFPLVILSHGFGGTHEHHLPEAKHYSDHGIGAFIYDFCGGSCTKYSDGSPMDMSVLTEAADLCTVMDGLCAMDEIDENRVFLMGFSQGGYVSGYVAGQRPDRVRGLILCFPALVIYDDTVKRVVDGVPEKMTIMDFEIGARYHRDALSVDIYKEIAKYKKPMLLIHGNADDIVPISYSEKLFQVMEDCTFLEYDGAVHGFDGDYLLDELDDAWDYIEGLL